MGQVLSTLMLAVGLALLAMIYYGRGAGSRLVNRTE
jgi:hypothetical protein